MAKIKEKTIAVVNTGNSVQNTNTNAEEPINAKLLEKFVGELPVHPSVRRLSRRGEHLIALGITKIGGEKVKPKRIYVLSPEARVREFHYNNLVKLAQHVKLTWLLLEEYKRAAIRDFEAGLIPKI